jgi:hypothetical protein
MRPPREHLTRIVASPKRACAVQLSGHFRPYSPATVLGTTARAGRGVVSVPVMRTRRKRHHAHIHAAQRSSTCVAGCLRIQPHGLNTASTNAMSRAVGETIGGKIKSPTASEADSPGHPSRRRCRSRLRPTRYARPGRPCASEHPIATAEDDLLG